MSDGQEGNYLAYWIHGYVENKQYFYSSVLFSNFEKKFIRGNVLCWEGRPLCALTGRKVLNVFLT